MCRMAPKMRKMSLPIVESFLTLLSHYEPEIFLSASSECDKKDSFSSPNLSDNVRVFKPWVKQRLLGYLQFFSKFKSFEQVPHESLLKSAFFHLISKSEQQVQSGAFNCLKIWKDKHILPYAQQLSNIINQKAFKETLLTFDINNLSETLEKSGYKQESEDPEEGRHKEKLIPLLSLILFTKFFNSSGEKSMKGSILNFLSKFSSPELSYFVQLLINKQGMGFIANIKSLSFSEEIAQHFSKIDTSKLVQYLNDLQYIISNLTQHFAPYVQKFIPIALLSLYYFHSRTESGKGSKRATLEGRKTCTKFFLQLLQLVDFHDSHSYVSFFLDTLSTSIEKMDSDSAVSPSGTLSFFLELCEIPSLAHFFFAERPSIVTKVISCLSSTSQEVVSGVIQFVHQLIFDKDEEMQISNSHFARENSTLFINLYHEVKMRNKRVLFSDSEFEIIKFFSEKTTSEEADKIVSIVVPLLENPKIPEEVKQMVVRIFESLLESVPQVQKYLPIVSKQFYMSGKDNSLRDKLLAILERISAKIPQLISKFFPIIKDFNAWREDALGKRDYEKREAAHNRLIEIFGDPSQQIDITALHLVMCNYFHQIETPDFAVRESALNGSHHLFTLLNRKENSAKLVSWKGRMCLSFHILRQLKAPL